LTGDRLNLHVLSERGGGGGTRRRKKGGESEDVLGLRTRTLNISRPYRREGTISTKNP